MDDFKIFSYIHVITYLTTGIKYKQKTQTKKEVSSDNIEYELETRVRGTEGQTMNAGKLWGTHAKRWP